jgi:PKD repeat protein
MAFRGERSSASISVRSRAVNRVPSRFSRLARRLRNRPGQSLVEFALILPILLLLTLTAIDFGRVYLGWINLQNMARSAANFAANNPQAWLVPNDTATITEYRNQVVNDAAKTNCVLTPGTPADPTFKDGDGDGKKTAIGDRAEVAFTCTFTLITPVISNIVGKNVNVSASAVFPVKYGQFAAAGGTGPTASFTASPTTTTTGTNIAFDSTASTGSPTTWSWIFGDNGTTVGSTAQNPSHAYSAAGTYTVSLTVTNANGSNTMTRTSYITVSAPAPVADFTASTTTPALGASVLFTDTSTGSPTTWLWSFGAGQGTSTTGPTVSHAYNTAGTYTVSLTVTGPGGSNSITKTNYIVVSAGTCTVPSFIGTSSSNAQTTWNAAGFTTTVQFQGGNLPWTIQSQTVVANSSAPCTTVITVKKT